MTRKETAMEVVFERCCGLDVHKATVVVCLWMRDQCGKIHKEIKTFGTMTADLLVLHDWLRSKEVAHVAMESTGVFWKPIYNLCKMGTLVQTQLIDIDPNYPRPPNWHTD